MTLDNVVNNTKSAFEKVLVWEYFIENEEDRTTVIIAWRLMTRTRTEIQICQVIPLLVVVKIPN